MSHVQLNCRTYRKGEKQQKVNKSRLSGKRVSESVYAWLCLGDILLISRVENARVLFYSFVLVEFICPRRHFKHFLDSVC